MTLDERSGERDLAYSRWHRPGSIGRFLPRDQADALTAIDIDSVEACHVCSRPLILLEVVRDVGQDRFKPTTITSELARLAGLSAALVFYSVGTGGDVTRFRVRYVAPRRTRELELKPAEYASWLQSLRERHTCTPPPATACRAARTRASRAETGAATEQRPLFVAPASVTTRVSAAAPLE